MSALLSLLIGRIVQPIIALIERLALRQLAGAAKRFCTAIAGFTIARAVSAYRLDLDPQGVDEREGTLIIRLELKPNHPVYPGDLIDVLNAASKTKWGVLSVLEVDQDSCVCEVFDRMNSRYWEDLEASAKTNPAPPSGLSFRREPPQEFLDLTARMLRDW